MRHLVVNFVLNTRNIDHCTTMAMQGSNLKRATVIFVFGFHICTLFQK